MIYEDRFEKAVVGLEILYWTIYLVFNVLPKKMKICLSCYLFQDLGYTPDFVLTAMAPYIKDIHKKGRTKHIYVSDCCSIFR